jgi:hypothetical protein
MTLRAAIEAEIAHLREVEQYNLVRGRGGSVRPNVLTTSGVPAEDRAFAAARHEGLAEAQRAVRERLEFALLENPCP